MQYPHNHSDFFDSGPLPSGIRLSDPTVRIFVSQSSRILSLSSSCPEGAEEEVKALTKALEEDQDDSKRNPLHRCDRLERYWNPESFEASVLCGCVENAKSEASRKHYSLLSFDPESLEINWIASAFEMAREFLSGRLFGLAVVKDNQGGRGCLVTTPTTPEIGCPLALWDPENGRCLGNLPGTQSHVSRLCALPEAPECENRVFAGGKDKVQQFDVVKQEPTVAYTDDGRELWLESLAISRERKILFAGNRWSRISAWDLRTAEEVIGNYQGVMGYFGIYLADDRNLLFGGATGGRIHVFDIRRFAAPMADFRVHQIPLNSTYYWIYDIDRIEDDLFVSGSEQKSVGIWNSAGTKAGMSVTTGVCSGCRVWPGHGDKEHFLRRVVNAESQERFAFVVDRLCDGGDSSWMMVRLSGGQPIICLRFPRSVFACLL